jgi:HNH endonuclease
MTNLKYECLYCGEPTRRGRRTQGEHIIPEAIGGALTLNGVSDRRVCTDCNTGVLSQIDNELCRRSILSVVASYEIDSRVWQAWDIDHEAKDLLLEARPLWGNGGKLRSLALYPQLTFEQSGPDIRGDREEFRDFGMGDSAKVLFKAIRHCYGRHRSGDKRALFFEPICPETVREYRFAPRMFTPHSIQEAAQRLKTGRSLCDSQVRRTNASRCTRFQT